MSVWVTARSCGKACLRSRTTSSAGTSVKGPYAARYSSGRGDTEPATAKL